MVQPLLQREYTVKYLLSIHVLCIFEGKYIYTPGMQFLPIYNVHTAQAAMYS